MTPCKTPPPALSWLPPAEPAVSPLVLLAVDEPDACRTVEAVLRLTGISYRYSTHPTEIVRLLIQRQVAVAFVSLDLLRPALQQCEPGSLLGLFGKASLFLMARTMEDARLAGIQTGGSVLHLFFGAPVFWQVDGLLSAALRRASLAANGPERLVREEHPTQRQPAY